ncbi:MAG TPA: GNAT family N-acetyltransferase [Ktedonobacterales bacterium]|jgi:RimJ/RimL family protein N-acetyltransferase|nr:GNAT family N-acetyltransferase [Ktedonobacterales bacterium]
MRIALETERLILRAFTSDDVDDLTALDSDPAVMRYLNGGVPTPREVIEREVLPRFIASSQQGDGYGVWAAIERATCAFVGWFGFGPHEGGAAGEVSLGYRLRRGVWGRGYATEGARALIRQGFTELGARRVVATTYQDNLASRRVMEKAGLRLARTFRMTPELLAVEGDTFVAGGELWDGDDVEYALERAEWERLMAHGEEIGEEQDDDAGLR